MLLLASLYLILCLLFSVCLWVWSAWRWWVFTCLVVAEFAFGCEVLFVCLIIGCLLCLLICFVLVGLWVVVFLVACWFWVCLRVFCIFSYLRLVVGLFWGWLWLWFIIVVVYIGGLFCFAFAWLYCDCRLCLMFA